MIYWCRGFQDERRGKGGGENIDKMHISGTWGRVGWCLLCPVIWHPFVLREK